MILEFDSCMAELVLLNVKSNHFAQRLSSNVEINVLAHNAEVGDEMLRLITAR